MITTIKYQFGNSRTKKTSQSSTNPVTVGEQLNDMRVGWNESFDKLDDYLKYEELS